MDSVSFMDLVASNHELEKDFVDVFRKVLSSGRFVGGPMVEDFEHGFAAFCNTRHCIGVSSGTDALRFALMAAGVRPGEIVITVPNTFIATTEAITQAGGIPDFVDINKNDYNMDTKKLSEYFTERCYFDEYKGKLINKMTGAVVSAVIPVHLYGQMADMDAVVELAEKFNLLVVEDACQAHGAKYFSRKDNQWKAAGSIGLAAAFSFYAGKNLGAFGEGGAVVTNNDKIAERIRMLRDHGQSEKYIHEFEGYNGRLDAIQAGILTVKLSQLTIWNEKRRALAQKYNELLETLDIGTPYENEWARSVYHLYVVRTMHRNELRNHLQSQGVATGLHYPIPLHLQKAYENLSYKRGSFPVAENAASELLSLPMYPELKEYQQTYVAERIKEFFKNSI